MNQQVKERLQYLASLHDHRLTPQIVIDDARDGDSPLHDCFTWDIEKAAYKQLLHEARQLIRSVKIEFKIESVKVNTVAYVRDPDKPSDEPGYISVDKVKSDREASRLILIDEFRRAGSALRRAQRLAKYFELENQVNELSEKIDSAQKSIEEMTAI